MASVTRAHVTLMPNWLASLPSMMLGLHALRQDRVGAMSRGPMGTRGESCFLGSRDGHAVAETLHQPPEPGVPPRHAQAPAVLVGPFQGSLHPGDNPLKTETASVRPATTRSASGHIVEPMAVADGQQRGRKAFARRMWGDAFTELSAARRERELDGEDLERLAVAAYMVGRDEACEEGWVAAHHTWVRRGEPERAAGCAFRHALGLFFRGDLAPAMGWVARGGRLLEERRRESVEQAWLTMLTALPSLFLGDTGVYPGFAEAGEVAERVADPDAAMFARMCCGYALILEGRIADGMALLDEVMVSVTADEVDPMLAGIAYCQVITLCQAVFDVRRAREWTEALTRWCDSQPELVPFRGNCLVHRCEILQLQGAWTDARDAARQACEWLAGPPDWDSLGSAHYQLAEIQRLRGELAPAEASYRRASVAGRDPEPGMSLLRLAQGRVDLAAAAIRRALDEAEDPTTRSRLLPACVEIMLEAGDVEAARAAADDLDRLASQHAAPYLSALADEASGGVLMADGEARAALAKLRGAHRSWRELEAPHQAARVRLLIGIACRELGDDGSAELEFAAARDALEELGAAVDLERLARLVGSPIPGGLSRREGEVLTLVAAGKTNRAIATELFISEKTVARHVSNIFTKLGLSSRSQATAYAYKRGLVR
jgi:DNA-binding NarL/FixJ family response regulator